MDSMKHYSTYQSQFIEMFGDPMTNSKEWPECGKINQYAQVILGTTPNSKEASYWDGDIKWITPAEMTDESYYIYDTERHITEEGVKSASLTLLPYRSVLFSTRAPIGKVGLAGSPMYSNQGFKNFICGEKLNPVYLYYSLIYKRDYLISLGTGTTFKELSKKTVEGLNMAVPPLHLQDQFESIYDQADKSKFISLKSQFIEMQMKSGQTNSLGDFIERCTPNRCGERTDLPILSVTKDKAIVFQDERFGAVVASNDKSNYIIAPRGYLMQGIHIDESNFGIQNLVDEGIVSPAYKLWRFKNSNAIPELIEYYLRSEMAIKYFRRKFLGATVPRRQVIRKEDFLDLPLNLPNMEEQKKYFRIYQQADKSKYIN